VIEATKSPVNFVVLDGPKGNTWEEALAYYLEHDARVASFVKNDHLDFMIPYVCEGVAHEFWPGLCCAPASGRGRCGAHADRGSQWRP
jgi:type III restriction enzyme